MSTARTFNSIDFSAVKHLRHFWPTLFLSHASTTGKNLVVSENFPYELLDQLRAVNCRLLMAARIKQTRNEDAGARN